MITHAVGATVVSETAPPDPAARPAPARTT
ncbi:MAG: hypothetical protein QOC94_3062 [Actinoplanes sp.]|jgi:hypothetical protein|nr:hypothetical protein [Actinoplanes sp.]MDT5039250.1 hypothetical protein [Actinoplanes sp.]